MTTKYIDHHSSLKETLRAVVNEDLPEELISEENQDWINSRVDQLPAFLSSFFGYECRLQDARPRADFLLCFHKNPGGNFFAANDILSPDYRSRSSWNGLNRFAKEWTQTGSPLNQYVQNMWLEFDIDGPMTDVPNLFAFFKPTGYSLARDSDTAWVFDGIQRLTGTAVSDSVKACVCEVIKALPAKGRVFQIAPMMMSRDEKALRLCIRDVSPREFPSFLKRAGWPGDGEQILRKLHWLRHFVDSLAINLDVADSVQPKIGLECYINFDHRVLPRTRALMDELVDRELCLAAKRDGILRYHGWTDERMNLDHWPVHLITESMLMRPGELSVFWRKLHHVKLVLRPDQELETKAYLLVTHNWLKPEILERARDFAKAG